jgi:uncharacterized membrane protein
MAYHLPEHNHDDHLENISTTRLEAFSDGVLAIIITITVLGFKIPEGSGFSALSPLLPLFITYAISFQTVGTYWNNHHHLLQATSHISVGMMWANLNLLFWLSLIPFTTGWLGANHGGSVPTAVYAAVLFLCSCSYSLLQLAVVKHSDKREQIMRELFKSKKGIISVVSYLLAVLLAFYNPIISDILILFVSLIWFIPDRRIAKFI